MDDRALRYRGVIEGFYGPMWSHADRLHLLQHMPDWRMNLYIYSPRHDPYHRFHWDKPYPPAVMAQMTELARTAADHGVQFAYAISPGNTFDAQNPAHHRTLVDKLRPFIELGSRFFPIFYDDLVDGFDPDSDTGEQHARMQAGVMNALADSVSELCTDARFLFCPTQYMTADKSRYLCTLHEQLDGRIETAVTGVDADKDPVCPRTFSDAGAQRYLDNFGRRPFLWDNFNVRDNALNVLHWSPYTGRGRNLDRICSGIVLNPQNVYLLNLPIFGCMGDYFADPRRYDPVESFQRHVAELMGERGAPLGMTLSRWFTSEWFAREGDGVMSSEANLPPIEGPIHDVATRDALLASIRETLVPLCDFGDRFVRTMMDPQVAATLVPYAEILTAYARAMVAFSDAAQGCKTMPADAIEDLLERTDRPHTQRFALPVSLTKYPQRMIAAMTGGEG